MLVVALGPPPDPPCAGPLTRPVVIRCARSASPRLRADQARVATAQGRADAARPLLPANPTVAVTLGHRWNTVGDRALNVAGTISQPLEISGARRKRKAAAAADVAAQEHASEATEREVIANALLAHYDVLSARAEVEVLERGRATAVRLQEVALARAGAGLAAPLASDLAAAEAARLTEQVALGEGRVRIAEARLASALGLDPTAPLPEVRGELEPLPTAPGLTAAVEMAATRPEVAARKAEMRTLEAEIGRLRRERAPTPSVSFFAQTDGFNERVIGGGLSLPIPLPFPLGRTNKGEIRAAQAGVREASERVAAQTRALTLEATTAYHELEARSRAASAYPQAAQASARRSLDDLSQEIETGRLPVRDALLTQQALIELLLRAVHSRHQLCRASVALALAAGTSFETGAP